MGKGHLYSGTAALLTGRPAMWYQLGTPTRKNVLEWIINAVPAPRDYQLRAGRADRAGEVFSIAKGRAGGARRGDGSVRSGEAAFPRGCADAN